MIWFLIAVGLLTAFIETEILASKKGGFHLRDLIQSPRSHWQSYSI